MKFYSGSLESCDCLIIVEESPKNIIEITSTVYELFGHLIKQTIEDVLKEHNIINTRVTIHDQGALDYTIKSRLITALQKKGDIDEK